MKLGAAIIGSGNIGTDLLYKLRDSELVEPRWMVGIDPASAGLARAEALGLKTTHAGLAAVIDEIARDGVAIAFDATSASEHAGNAALLAHAGVFSIDLTPAALGPYCVPSVNLRTRVGEGVGDVNLVSCGGQATIPMVAAVTRVQPVGYAEIVATVASKSAGPAATPARPACGISSARLPACAGKSHAAAPKGTQRLRGSRPIWSPRSWACRASSSRKSRSGRVFRASRSGSRGRRSAATSCSSRRRECRASAR
jgi:hypothetical protein